MKKAPGVRHTIQSEPNALISSSKDPIPLHVLFTLRKTVVLQRPTHPLCMFFVWIDQPWKIGIRNVPTKSARESKYWKFSSQQMFASTNWKEKKKTYWNFFSIKRKVFFSTYRRNILTSATSDLKGGIMST